MKLPHAALLTGIVLMAAAFVVPKLFGGRAALRGELERELAASGELHMETAQTRNGSAAGTERTAEQSLEQRVDTALNRGQGTARVLKWLGIGVTLVGVVMLAVDSSKAGG